ncbi:MAG: prepilin peptidase [Roseburia sp.]|nr:prepilin peptidase [Roseburia sp.]
MIGDTVILGVLAISAYRDWMEKKIYIYGPIFCGIIGILLHVLFQERTLADMLGGAAVGAAVLLVAWLGRECVGIGDGIILVVSGVFLGFWRNLTLLLTALVLAAMAALFLLVVKRKERKYRLPFVPFLLAAYLMQLI